MGNVCIMRKLAKRKTNVEIYWKNVGLNKQYILGSQDIIDINNENIKHAKKYNYKIIDSENIIKILKKIFKSQKGGHPTEKIKVKQGDYKIEIISHVNPNIQKKIHKLMRLCEPEDFNESELPTLQSNETIFYNGIQQ